MPPLASAAARLGGAAMARPLATAGTLPAVIAVTVVGAGGATATEGCPLEGTPLRPLALSVPAAMEAVAFGGTESNVASVSHPFAPAPGVCTSSASLASLSSPL